MPRPKGFKPSRRTRLAIGAARVGKKWSDEVKAAIGAQVRHGAKNKVPFNTRIDPEVAARFREKAKARNIKLSPAIEQAMEAW